MTDLSNLTIRKRTVSTLILFLFITAPLVLSAEIISLVMLLFLTFWVLISSRLPNGLGFLIWPIAVIMIVGMLGAWDKPAYDIVKDVWYVGKAALALTTGYILMFHIKDFKSLFKIVLISAAITSLFHILQFIHNPILLTKSLVDIREEAGQGYFICIIAVAIIVACWRTRIVLFPKMRWFVRLTLSLCLLSFILSYSRTLCISLAIMLMVVFDLLSFKKVKKSILVLTGMIVFFAVVVSIISESARGSSTNTFTGKAIHSVQEIIIRDYTDRADITRNWRGYESFRAMETYLDGEWLQYFIGKGFGALVDVGFYLQLGREEHRFIPVLHNGYMYLLVKTGLLGLFMYLFYFTRLIRYGQSHSRSINVDLRLAGRLIVALVLVILATTLVIGGLFNKSSLFPVIIVLGALIAYVRFSGYAQRLPSIDHELSQSPLKKG